MLRPVEGLEIDGFTLGPCLHQGGFATIWSVTHPDHADPMVMKVPTILDGEDAPTIVGFEIEQMILPRLSGPHVPRVIAIGDFGAPGGMPYLVTEQIAGGSLHRIFDAAPLPLDQVVPLACDILRAVGDLHRQGVLHLDLKPSNLMRRDTDEWAGALVCIDFGLAHHRRLPDLLSEEFTVPMGTYPYIAPEQLIGQRSDLRSDLYAVGVMLYQLVTGRLPFGFPHSPRGARARMWRDPVPPRAYDPMMPDWLQEVILRLIDPDPDQRPASAAQLLFDLEHPHLIARSERATRTRPDGFWTRFRRRLRLRAGDLVRDPDHGPMLDDTPKPTPVLLAAIDLSPAMEPLSARIAQTIRDLLDQQPGARVACVNIIRLRRLGVDEIINDAGEHLHVTRLVQLRAWGQQIGLSEERLTFTVLEDSDPAGALIAHARRVMATHIVMGARGASGARRFLGSVSSRVVAEAPCDVTVLRLPADLPPQRT